MAEKKKKAKRTSTHPATPIEAPDLNSQATTDQTPAGNVEPGLGPIDVPGNGLT